MIQSYFNQLDIKTVSDKDIRDVAGNAGLRHSDLENLFVVLGLQADAIENAQRLAGTNDYKLQAASVLRSWRETNGNAATKQVIINALEECQYTGAVEILLGKWGMQNQGIVMVTLSVLRF